MSLLRRRAAELARRVPSFSRAPSSSFSRASSSSTVDVATEAEVKADSLLPMEQEGDAVGFAQTRLTWKPRPSSQRVAVETSQLFCASNDPLEQTAEDAGRFFQLDGSTNAFDVFYHNGYCGENVASRNAHLKTSAMMVRREGIRLRDDLLNLDSNSNLADAAGWILAGEKGVGKSMVLNYILAAMQRAGWLVAVVPHAADWTLGLSARSAQAANEAYRVTDPSYFNQVPPELEGSSTHENPEASAHFLMSFYLSQRDKLATIPIKDEERRAHYASAAADPKAGPTLADMLGTVARDSYQAFADFPMPARPVHDLLRELQSVTEYPTLIVVDGWNRWSQMATSCHWRTKRPLHASDLMVPAMLGGDLSYGKNMARGVMLGATTHNGAQPPGVPMRLRKHIPPPPDFQRKLHALRREDRFRGRIREVAAYSASETQAMLEFYALCGHMHNPLLGTQLRTGELARKVRLMTAGNGEDLYQIAHQM